MFLNLLVSSWANEYSFTICNAASSPLTLTIMLLVVVVVFLPPVLLSQGWVYKTFRDKVPDEMLASDHSYE